MPTSYFARETKIKTQAQMMDVLKNRIAEQGKLVWLAPEGSHQRATDGRYEIRAIKGSNDDYVYWAWSLLAGPIPKLIGYSKDPKISRNFCEADALRKSNELKST